MAVDWRARTALSARDCGAAVLSLSIIIRMNSPKFVQRRGSTPLAAVHADNVIRGFLYMELCSPSVDRSIETADGCSWTEVCR
jgi:hypothetical protein